MLTGGATPVPIPNTEVKPSRADGTAAGNALALAGDEGRGLSAKSLGELTGKL